MNPYDSSDTQNVTKDALWIGPARLFAYFFLVPVWVLCVSVLLIGVAVASGETLQSVSTSGLLTSPLAVAMTTTLQTGGMLAIAMVLAKLLPWPTKSGALRRALALRRPDAPLLIAGFLGGFTVGWLPGYIAEWLAELFPWLSLGNNEMIAGLLTQGHIVERAMMFLVVAGVAPLFEELVFRGFLWDALARFLPVPVVWLVTTLMFAAFHLDPISAVALIFTGGFLGVLRAFGTSIWPCVAGHFANNLLAAVVSMTAFASTEVPFPVALAGALITIGLLAVGVWGSGVPHPSSPTSE